MPTYPTSLPGPSQPFPFAGRERRAASPGDGPIELRGRFREQIIDARGVLWRYSPAEMEVWRDWWKTDLIDGLMWFDVMLPGPGGWQQRMARFVSGSKREHKVGGIYEVSADLEINLSRLPPQPRPVLLMHLDGDLVDATGITTFAIPAGFSAPSYAAADDPAFGQMVVATSNAAVGTSSRSLSIGTRKFTIEGRCKFGAGDSGGIVLAKNHWPSEPSPSSLFKDDFSVGVSPTTVALTWTGGSAGRGAAFPAIVGETFTWSLSDDGVHCYTHINGVLVDTDDSCSLDSFTPPLTSGSITVLNKLQGFSGSGPDWISAPFDGQCDELRMWLDFALYGPEDYEPATVPFSYP